MAEQGVLQSQWTTSHGVSMLWCGKWERHLAFHSKAKQLKTNLGGTWHWSKYGQLAAANRRVCMCFPPSHSKLTLNHLAVLKHVTWRPQKLLFFAPSITCLAPSGCSSFFMSFRVFLLKSESPHWFKGIWDKHPWKLLNAQNINMCREKTTLFHG